mmetsp:Transcript_35318/g.99240  ORF Transcript_35318/g.99240 Transcript_35318/m.99240 type:complete len:216 (-) Transcript_35318:185-832(-)
MESRPIALWMRPQRGHCVLRARSSSPELPIACLNPICRPWMNARRSWPWAATVCAASAVSGPSALPFMSFPKKVPADCPAAVKFEAASADIRSSCKARPAGSSRPSTALVFNAPGTLAFRKFSCASRPKNGQPDWAIAAQGTSRRSVSTGDESCSRPEKICTSTAGSSTAANESNCKQSFPKPHSSAAPGAKASAALRSLIVFSIAAPRASRLAS